VRGDRLTTWLVTGGALACLVALELLNTATVEQAPDPVDACDVLPEDECACELDPVVECLLAATTCEAARECGSVVE
jgi:hypothetical protein